MEERKFKGIWIPREIWITDELSLQEKVVLVEIDSLDDEEHGCYASNKYLANLFDTTEITISRKLRKLSEKGYITIEYEKRGAEVTNRYIRLTKMLTDDYQNCKPTINKNVKENNISIKNISINKKEIYKERFKKPSLEEVKEYCLERNNGIDAEQFIDFYESKGWLVGKTKMKDWKACIRTWERNHKPTKEEIIPEWFDKETENEELTTEDLESMSWLNEL